MSQRKEAAAAPSLCHPLRLLDTLGLDSEQMGNTPRPSTVRANVVAGLRRLDGRTGSGGSEPEEAHRLLLQAVQEAQVMVKLSEEGEEVVASKEDSENMAIACTAMGYFFAVTGKADKATSFYRKAAQYWGRLHKKRSPIMLQLYADMATVYRLAGEVDKALETLRMSEDIVKESLGVESAERGHCLALIGATQAGDEAVASFTEALRILRLRDTEQYRQSLVFALVKFIQFLRGAKGREEAAGVDSDELEAEMCMIAEGLGVPAPTIPRG